MPEYWRLAKLCCCSSRKQAGFEYQSLLRLWWLPAEILSDTKCWLPARVNGQPRAIQKKAFVSSPVLAGLYHTHLIPIFWIRKVVSSLKNRLRRLWRGCFYMKGCNILLVFFPHLLQQTNYWFDFMNINSWACWTPQPLCFPPWTRIMRDVSYAKSTYRMKTQCLA